MDKMIQEVGIVNDRECDSLRILLSAYACEPHKGSEPGVGWQWARNLARSGHEVWVITRANNSNVIDRALRAESLPNLHFAYTDLPRWARFWKCGGHGVHLYYLLWQWWAYRVAKRLDEKLHFDIAHHITFGVFRQPSFIAFLSGVPFVFGPVGGGERTPVSLRGSFPWRGRLIDSLRDLVNLVARFDPLMRAVYAHSDIILCKTGETAEAIPGKYRSKCRLQLEIGVPEGTSALKSSEARSQILHILFVGRLIYWKGLHLGLAAFARLVKSGINARLTIVGNGQEKERLSALARSLGISDWVDWVSWLPRDELMQVYFQHDALLFPSLHDSSGNVVLEAMSCGLPVICLNLGGPAVLVDESSGFRVSGSDPQQLILGLAQGLTALTTNDALRRAMGQAAQVRAREEFSWNRQIARMNLIYQSLPGITRAKPWPRAAVRT